MSPFLLRHALILLCAIANLGAAMYAMWLARHVALKAIASGWVAGALFLLAVAGSAIWMLEGVPWPEACGRWNSVSIGMTKAQVRGLLGEPREIAEQYFFYELHPFGRLDGVIEFETDKVKSRTPAFEWLSEPMRVWFRQHLRDACIGFGLFGIAVVTLVSLLPFGMSQGWLSLPLYYPVFALMFALGYESQQEGSWRFDLVFIIPGYVLIGIAWMVRVIWLFRRPL